MPKPTHPTITHPYTWIMDDKSFKRALIEDEAIQALN